LVSVFLVGAWCVGCGGQEGGETAAADSVEAAPPNPTPVVVLETTMGQIVMELDREKAPESVDNFERHVRLGYYDSLVFHRVRVGWMIQAGAYTAEFAQKRSSAPPVRNESNNGLRNLRGTVAMARTLDPHSATTQFFINLVDSPGQDYSEARDIPWGYAVFGRVIEGLDVADAISRVPIRRRGQHEAVPIEPVVITRAYVREVTAG
jgi:cyclophilin family peptidyl-prolyl cis-trans isomerase